MNDAARRAPSTPTVEARLHASLDAHLAPLRRRQLLKGTAGAAILGGLAGPLAGCDETKTPYTNLEATAAADMRKLVEVLLPIPEGGTLVPTAEVPVVANVDAMLGNVPGHLREDLDLGLRLFHYGAIVLGWHFRTFPSLTREAATAYCRRWQSGGATQRGLMAALKEIVYVAYWREPATWPPIGYDGPVTEPNGIPRLGVAPAPEEL